jgi:triosephosphate isomerase
LQSAIKLAADVAAATKDVSPRDVEIAVCPPYPFIRDVQKVINFCLLINYIIIASDRFHRYDSLIYRDIQALEGSNVKVGAQNSYYQLQGAYTGAVSAPMLASCGIQYSLVGKFLSDR